MTEDSQALAIEGVRFFGEMSASISHEMKNVLAIINENAGLLQDMILMAEKGMPLSPERLSSLAQSVARQVGRGDRIVKGMNQFAHSADQPTETVDVGELIGFLIDLASRLITMKGNAPEIEVSDGLVKTVTNRFFLKNIVWVCLSRALDACAEGKTVTIVVERVSEAVRIRFCNLDPDHSLLGTDFPSPRETLVARLLGATLTADHTEGEIVFILS